MISLFRSFNDRQLKIFIAISVITTCNAFCFALQAPFFPDVAASKGATELNIGMIFGMFQLVIFLASPIFGRNISKIGAKAMMISGAMTTGCSCVVFGTLYFVNGRYTFLALCVCSRFCEALGCAACNTASFSIVAHEFPNKVGGVMSTLETFFGFGLIIGPSIGGCLYELAGYVMPFCILGSCLVLCALLYAYYLPNIGVENSETSTATMAKLLTIKEILLSVLGTFAASTNIGFLQAHLNRHLDFVHLSPSLLGLVFVVNGLTYALIAPLWGLLCDRGISTLLLPIFGASIIVDAFHLIGPAPYVPCNPSLRLIILSLVMNGMGTGGELIPSFIGAQKFARKAGFEDNLTTLGTVSGLWTSVFALGAFVGPTLGGVLIDYFGFRFSTLYIIALHSFLILTHAAYFISKYFFRYRGTKQDETFVEKLLNDNSISIESEIKISKDASISSDFVP